MNVDLHENLEIRKLTPNRIKMLADILGNDWKLVMEFIPREVGQDGSIIDGSPKYNERQIAEIENYVKDGNFFETLIDEWGTSGKIRPTLTHLFKIVIDCQLFRAADHLADLLRLPYPMRPATGPAAAVPIPELDEEDTEEHENPQLIPHNTTNTIEIQNRNDNNDKGYTVINKIQLPNTCTDLITPIETRSSNNRSYIPPNFDVLIKSNSIELQNNQQTEETNLSSRNSAIQPNSNTQYPPIPRQDSLPRQDAIPNFDMLMNNSRPLSVNSFQPDIGALMADSTPKLDSMAYFPAVLLGDSSSSEIASGIISNSNDSVNSRTDFIPSFGQLNLNSSTSNRPPLSITDFNPDFSALIPSAKIPDIVTPSRSIIRFTFNSLKSATDTFNNKPYNSFDFMDGRKLGAGGFSDVYLAINLETTIQYSAVKKIKKDHEKFKEKFDLEIKILSQLSHPNVIQLLGYSDDLNEFCLVYEYIRGGNLREKLTIARLKLEILEWQHRIRIIIGCAEGIAYLHSKNIIHRDIKSTNILLNHIDYSPKICDFGLIREMDATHSTQIMGTFEYAAPEIFHNEMSPAADVYSFGAVLLEIVTGLMLVDKSRENPNLISYFKELLRSDNFPYNTFVDAKAGNWGRIGTHPNLCSAHVIVDMCKKCLELDAKLRPASIEIVHFLNEWLNKFF